MSFCLLVLYSPTIKRLLFSSTDRIKTVVKLRVRSMMGRNHVEYCELLERREGCNTSSSII